MKTEVNDENLRDEYGKENLIENEKGKKEANENLRKANLK